MTSETLNRYRACIYKCCQNLVGSIHTFESDLEIFVYDLGLDEEQKIEIKMWNSVTVVAIDMTHFPPHVQSLNNYAWKACVIRHASESLRCFLFLDAGMELRDSLNDIRAKVTNYSNWFVTASNGRRFSTLAGVVHPGTLQVTRLDSKSGPDRHRREQESS